MDIDRTPAAITSLIESCVCEHPDQWPWLHDRWGTNNLLLAEA